MSSPSNQPRSAGRSRKRFFGLLAAGLGLVALVAGYLVVQYLRTDGADDSERPESSAATETATAGVEADFADATCEDFDLAEFEAFSGGAAEFDTAIADAYAATETGVLYCEYTSDSGMTLSLTALADTAEGFAESTMDQSRKIWGGAPDIYTIEDFDNGDLTGYSNSYTENAEQVLLLNAGADRLLITVGLNAEPGGFEVADALVLAELMAGRVLERFEAYV